MPYSCKICDKEFDNIESLSKHSRKYKKTSEEVYIEYVLNGVPPTCGCGCGEVTNYLSIHKGFNDYIRGHSSRINNNWGHNPEAIKKSHETQKKLYESGKLVIWNKGLTKEDDIRLDYGDKIKSHPNRAKKISESLIGKKRSKEVLEKLDKGMREYWSKVGNREKQRENRVEYMNKYQYQNKTLLELSFESLLESLGIRFVSQYMMCGYNFDYYIPNKDVIIEVDGDFWHCNPEKYPNGPIYDSQKVTIKNDEKKGLICENTKGITLLRFWETDINERPEWVMSELSKHL